MTDPWLLILGHAAEVMQCPLVIYSLALLTVNLLVGLVIPRYQFRSRDHAHYWLDQFRKIYGLFFAKARVIIFSEFFSLRRAYDKDSVCKT